MSEREESSLKTWAKVVGMAAAIVLWGLFLHSAIGERGQPGWDFSAVEDIPGSSPYAVHGPKESPSAVADPERENAVLAPQHVAGRAKP